MALGTRNLTLNDFHIVLNRSSSHTVHYLFLNFSLWLDHIWIKSWIESFLNLRLSSSVNKSLNISSNAKITASGFLFWSCGRLVVYIVIVWFQRGVKAILLMGMIMLSLPSISIENSSFLQISEGGLRVASLIIRTFCHIICLVENRIVSLLKSCESVCLSCPVVKSFIVYCCLIIKKGDKPLIRIFRIS